MFNDERINSECGKIYRNGILLAVITTLIYSLTRTITLLIQGALSSLLTYTEAAILILGGGILLIGALRFRRDGDERTVFESHAFYKKAGKIFILTVLGAYILTIPFTTQEMLGGQAHNHLLLLLEVLGYLYLFYAFKTRDININYSFITEKGSLYYTRVLTVIGGLWLGLLIPFLIAATWELALHNSPAGAIAILIAYISSSVGLSVEYFFISLIEKTSYDSSNGRRFALGTRIAMLFALVAQLSVAILQCIYVHFVTGSLQNISGAGSIGQLLTTVSQYKIRAELLTGSFQSISGAVSIGQLLTTVSQYRTRAELLLIVITGLVICHVLSQIKRGGLLYSVCRIKLLLLAASALEITLAPIWNRALSEDARRFLSNNLDPYLRFISFAISLTLWILFVHSLIKELQASRILWTAPALFTVVYILNIFFNSQSMLRVSTYCSLGAEMLCSLLVFTVLWRYNGFSIDCNTES